MVLVNGFPLSELPFLGMKLGPPSTASHSPLDPEPSDSGAPLWAWRGACISPWPGSSVVTPCMDGT